MTRQGRGRSRLGPLAIALIAVLAVIAVLALRGGGSSGGTPAATPPPTQAAAQTTPTESPGLVVPTAAIPLPRCPSNTAPQVDNPARYGFCTPVGWGAYNNNNTLPLTLIMKPRPGGPGVLLPTEFDRIKVVVALNTQAGASEPAECRGAPNDSIDGLATHHCSATLDPTANPYHAVRAEFWTIDLFQDRRFYINALLGPDTTADDDAEMNMVVHAVKPPATP